MVSLLGFDPQGVNGPDELFALGFTITVIPGLLYLAAVFVIARYPLSAERLDRLRAALQRRQARRSIDKPVAPVK